MITLQILNIKKNASGKPQQAAKLCKSIRTSALPIPIHGHRSYGNLKNM
jgi:pyruvate carboxylase